MARKKKARPVDEGPVGAPEWVVTFTDMISLLVTFFVLLMTFSSMEEWDKLRVDGLLGGTRGVMPIKGHRVVDGPKNDVIASSDVQRGANVPHSRPVDALSENIADMGQKKREGDLALNLNDVKDGLRIQFGPEASFKPGSADVGPDLAKSLGEIARILEHYPHLVVVEGHTDSEFKPSVEYPDEVALSLARARSAVQVMLAESQIEPKLLQVAGLGSDSPRASNLLPDGRRDNRRVEIRVLSLSKLRAAHIEAERWR